MSPRLLGILLLLLFLPSEAQASCLDSLAQPWNRFSTPAFNSLLGLGDALDRATVMHARDLNDFYGWERSEIGDFLTVTCDSQASWEENTRRFGLLRAAFERTIRRLQGGLVVGWREMGANHQLENLFYRLMRCRVQRILSTAPGEIHSDATRPRPSAATIRRWLEDTRALHAALGLLPPPSRSGGAWRVFSRARQNASRALEGSAALLERLNAACPVATCPVPGPDVVSPTAARPLSDAQAAADRVIQGESAPRTAPRRRWRRDEREARRRREERDRVTQLRTLFSGARGQDLAVTLDAVSTPVQESRPLSPEEQELLTLVVGPDAPVGPQSSGSVEGSRTSEGEEAEESGLSTDLAEQDEGDQSTSGGATVLDEESRRARAFLADLGLGEPQTRWESPEERRSLEELRRVAIEALRRSLPSGQLPEGLDWAAFGLDRDLARSRDGAADRQRRQWLVDWQRNATQARQLPGDEGIALLRRTYFPELASDRSGVLSAFRERATNLEGASELLLAALSQAPPEGRTWAVATSAGGALRAYLLDERTGLLLDPFTGESRHRGALRLYRPAVVLYRFLEQERAAGARVEIPVALASLEIPQPRAPEQAREVRPVAGEVPRVSPSARPVAPVPQVRQELPRVDGMLMLAGPGLGAALDSSMGSSPPQGPGARYRPSVQTESEAFPGAQVRLREDDLRAMAALFEALGHLLRIGIPPGFDVGQALSRLALRSLSRERIARLQEAGVLEHLARMASRAGDSLELQANLDTMVRLLRNARDEDIQMIGRSGVLPLILGALEQGPAAINELLQSPLAQALPESVRNHLQVMVDPELETLLTADERAPALSESVRIRPISDPGCRGSLKEGLFEYRATRAALVPEMTRLRLARIADTTAAVICGARIQRQEAAEAFILRRMRQYEEVLMAGLREAGVSPFFYSTMESIEGQRQVWSATLRRPEWDDIVLFTPENLMLMERTRRRHEQESPFAREHRASLERWAQAITSSPESWIAWLNTLNNQGLSNAENLLLLLRGDPDCQACSAAIQSLVSLLNSPERLFVGNPPALYRAGRQEEVEQAGQEASVEVPAVRATDGRDGQAPVRPEVRPGMPRVRILIGEEVPDWLEPEAREEEPLAPPEEGTARVRGGTRRDRVEPRERRRGSRAERRPGQRAEEPVTPIRIAPQVLMHLLSVLPRDRLDQVERLMSPAYVRSQFHSNQSVERREVNFYIVQRHLLNSGPPLELRQLARRYPGSLPGPCGGQVSREGQIFLERILRDASGRSRGQGREVRCDGTRIESTSGR